jgi:hypothetical protein
MLEEQHTLKPTDYGLHVMLAELESNRLEVVLVPSKRAANPWDMIRVCASRNAAWYRKFCAAHSSTRKRSNPHHDTCIRRANTISVLSRLTEGKRTHSKYAEELLNIAAKIK